MWRHFGGKREVPLEPVFCPVPMPRIESPSLEPLPELTPFVAPFVPSPVEEPLPPLPVFAPSPPPGAPGFQPEIVPPDPPLVRRDLPILPPWNPPSYVRPIMDEYLEAKRQSLDLKSVRIGTIASLVVTAGAFLFHPLVGGVAAVVMIAMALGWAISLVAIRRPFKEDLKAATRREIRERRERELQVQAHERSCQEITETNEQARITWVKRVADLAAQRIGLEERNGQARAAWMHAREVARLAFEQMEKEREAAWMEQVARIRTVRQQIEARNTAMRAEYECRRANLEHVAKSEWENEQRKIERRREDIQQRNSWRSREHEKAVAKIRASVEDRNRESYRAWEVEVRRARSLIEETQRHNAALETARQACVEEQHRRQSMVKTLQHQLDDLRALWTKKCTDAHRSFADLRRRLGDGRGQYELLRAAFSTQRQDLQNRVREQQFEDHLRSTLIEDATISGIGKARKATLAAYGIETAMDVDSAALERVRGFGETLRGELIKWRRSVEQAFRFDAARGIPLADLRALSMSFHQRRSVLQIALREGPNLLGSISRNAVEEMEHLSTQASRLVQQLAQAEADLCAPHDR